MASEIKGCIKKKYHKTQEKSSKKDFTWKSQPGRAEQNKKQEQHEGVNEGKLAGRNKQNPEAKQGHGMNVELKYTWNEAETIIQ